MNKYTNAEKRKIKDAICARIQELRGKAYDAGRSGNGKLETEYFNAVNGIRSELYVNGFTVESFAGGFNKVNGVGVEVHASRGAKWDNIVRVFSFLAKFDREG